MYVMTEEDVRFCEEMAEWQKSHPGNFDVVFLAFRDKLWELAKKYHLNPDDAFKIYISNYEKYVNKK